MQPAGSQPPASARLGSNRSAVAVTEPMVPISRAENSCSGVATVGAEVAMGATTGEGVASMAGVGDWGSARISVWSRRGRRNREERAY